MKPELPAMAPYDTNRLFSYALWYSGKYRVSRARLLEKLNGKSADSAAIAEVMSRLDPYHSDAAEIRSFADSCLARSKPIRYVKDSLRRKRFLASDIDSILAEYEWFDEYELFSRAIETRIRNLVEKGNGPRWIESDLVGKYPQFSQRIHSRCLEFDETELLSDFLKSRHSPCGTDSPTAKELKKIQDTLIRKGFSYSCVRKCLQNRGLDRDFES